MMIAESFSLSKSQAGENPYAPPESEAGFRGPEAVPESFWMKGDRLFVIDGAILPDVCLQTGKVEGEMSRFRENLRWRPERIYLYLAVVFLISLGVRLHFAPWILLAGLLVTVYLRRSILVVVCYSREVRKRQQRLHLAKWGVISLAMAFLLFTSFDPDVRLLAAIAITLIGLFLLRCLDHSFRVVQIKKRVAVLEGVHPEALRQLERWLRAHAPGTSPMIIDVP